MQKAAQIWIRDTFVVRTILCFVNCFKNPETPEASLHHSEATEESKEMKMDVDNRKEEGTVEERYTQWKSLIPVLYDWLANHNLVWPSLSCRFVPTH